MRLSRPCYNKPHRCPGWVGGGWVDAKVNRCPQIGYVQLWRENDSALRGIWRWGRCSKCDVRTIPFALRKLDPSYHWHNIKDWLQRRRWERQHPLNEGGGDG